MKNKEDERFNLFKRIQVVELRPLENYEIADTDHLKKQNIHFNAVDYDYIKKGRGMIARNPLNHKDQWFLRQSLIDEEFSLVEEIEKERSFHVKSLHNTDSNGAKKNVKDIVFFGDGDLFKLISKASSKNEGWMKSTKAMEIEGVGCVVQTTTQQRNPDGSYSLTDAVVFVPNVKIEEDKLQGESSDDVKIIRKLVKM